MRAISPTFKKNNYINILLQIVQTRKVNYTQGGIKMPFIRIKHAS